MVEILFYLLVFLYFVYQGGFIILKTSIFLFLAFIPFLNSGRFVYFNLSRDFLKVLFFWFFYFFLSVMFSLINGFKLISFKDIFNIFLLIPLCIPVAKLLVEKISLLKMYRFLIIITFLIIFLNLGILILDLYGLRTNSILNLFFGYDYFGALINRDGDLFFRSMSNVSMIYLMPLNQFLLFYAKNNFALSFKRLLTMNILFGLFLILITGRRALQYSYLASFLILLIINLIERFDFKSFSLKKFNFLPKFSFFNIFISILLILLLINTVGLLIETISLQELMDRFFVTFTSALNKSRGGTITRDIQYEVLINGWLESPIIGNGFTACAKLFWRCKYEPQFHAMLYQNGLIGATVYLSFIYFCLFGKQLPKIQSFFLLNYKHAIPYSTIWFILAASSNPFGYNVIIWIIMIYYCFIRENDISNKKSFAS